MLWLICVFWSAAVGLAVDLTGKWRIENKNKSICIEGNVPGSVYSALEENFLTEGPILYRFNDVKYRWIDLEGWDYSLDFNVPEESLAHSRSLLVFDGVDTASEILLNGVKIGSTSNMFVKYFIDVNAVVKAGPNSLQVRLESPIRYSRRMYENQLRSYLVPPACVVPEFNGECHANHIRKMQASFGWDWGPALPTLGLWKPVQFESFNTARLRDVLVSTTPSLDGWVVIVSCNFHTATLAPVRGQITVKIPELNIYFREDVVLEPDSNKEAAQDVRLFAPADIPVDLWWPKGYGNQTQYNLIVSFFSEDEKQRKVLRIGFRTVKLIEDPIEGTEGLSFYFRINGIPIFLKGSNWIPVDILPEKSTQDRIRHLLVSAVNANMNVLRVWGGGIYESDYFYKLASELGLMIWQDMMFACSMYPTNKEFLDSVTSEVRQQVRRLQHHPSIIVWAGNNENEAALRGDWYETKTNFSLYKSDYIKLYVDTIRQTILTEDQTRPYLISSPTNGLQSEREGFVASNPYSNLFGDVHFYNYYGNAWDWTIYPKPRMASEYGFQSLPSFEAIKDVSLPEDWDYHGDWLNSRQHHPLGALELVFQVSKRLGPPRSHSKEQYFKDMIYLTQMHQAYALKVQTEHYRRCRNKTFDDSSGLTMGAMYWQLNDVWAAPSWASIESDGRWKPLHFYAKKFFAPVIATAFEFGDELIVDVVSDHMDTLTNLRLDLVVMSWSTFEPIATKQIKFDAPPLSAVTVIEVNIATMLNDTTCGPIWQRRCFILTLLSDDRGRRVGYFNFYLPESFPVVENLQEGKVEVKALSKRRGKGSKETCFDIVLTTNAIAPFVYISSGSIQGQFSYNGFLLFKNAITIRFCSKHSVGTDELMKELSVTSLSDIILN